MPFPANTTETALTSLIYTKLTKIYSWGNSNQGPLLKCNLRSYAGAPPQIDDSCFAFKSASVQAVPCNNGTGYLFCEKSYLVSTYATYFKCFFFASLLQKYKSNQCGIYFLLLPRFWCKLTQTFAPLGQLHGKMVLSPIDRYICYSKTPLIQIQGVLHNPFPKFSHTFSSLASVFKQLDQCWLPAAALFHEREVTSSYILTGMIKFKTFTSLQWFPVFSQIFD
jgi:hypothetical protein